MTEMLVSDFVAQTKAAIASITAPDISMSTVDINNCDREPIHIPAAVQPHGVLIAARPDSWTITHVSQNSTEQIGRSPADLLGNSLHTLLHEEQISAIQACLRGDFEAVNPLRLTLEVERASRAFAMVVHRSNDVVVLEFEPVEDLQQTFNFFDFHKLVKRPISRFQQAKSLGELCRVAVEELKQVTGFDRVMVYRFDEDGSGSVIAEAKQPDMTPYLGLRYPATDIPKQAKYLYLLNLLRLIPEVGYEPVPVVTASDTNAGQADAAIESPTALEGSAPLDMTLSALRSVSPLHTEYLTNMGVCASMSISLVTGNQLWGLIACHHNSPRRLPYEQRTICEFLGQAIALELAAKETNENIDYKLKIKALQTKFVETLTHSETLKDGLTDDPQSLLALTNSAGAAFCENGEITLIGETPEIQDIEKMLPWLDGEFASGAVYSTTTLSQDYLPAADFTEHASGLLALSISRAQRLCVLWFRPEVVQTVDWGGNPEKPVETSDGGVATLSPRRSFALWRQIVQFRSLPWLSCEIEAALELRSAVIGLVLQRADELAQLNSELERSNVELDNFAYIASHDLKEPLRGIHSYSSFLIEDYGDRLGDDGTRKLQTLMRLTTRMEDLIGSLLHYSRIGRAELLIEPVDLNQLVEGVVNLIQMSRSKATSFIIPEPLPTFACDQTQVTELFTNLISNAVKYNDKPEKQVEIGCMSAQEAMAQGCLPDSLRTSIGDEAAAYSSVFYVRDNGIGIKQKHMDAIFRIFKRLHAQNRFGGGTGAGLTIAKKVVERHGGSLWLTSTFGEGSTFYFTLEQASSQSDGAAQPPSEESTEAIEMTGESATTGEATL
ncbi:MAG: ATP-binding protein [Cyanobacteria bacterium J06627_28]